jgi:FtsH-binding integral membrane protein
MSVAQLVGQMAPIMVIIGWICTAIIFCLTVVYWRWTIKNAVLQNKVLKDVIKGSQGTDITESKK